MRTMPDNKKSSDNEKWKDQLSFISGNILAWGLVVFNFLPSLSHFQTGLNIHFWTVSQDFRAEYLFFFYSAALLAMACSVVVLSISHIFSRGIWLILPENSFYIGKLESLCKTLFDTIIIFLIFMLIY